MATEACINNGVSNCQEVQGSYVIPATPAEPSYGCTSAATEDETIIPYDHFCGSLSTDHTILAHINRALSGLSDDKPNKSSSTSDIPRDASKTYSSPVKDDRKLDTSPETSGKQLVPADPQHQQESGINTAANNANESHHSAANMSSSSKRPGGRLISSRRPSQQWDEKVVQQYLSGPRRQSRSNSRHTSASAGTPAGKQKSGTSVWSYQSRQSRRSMTTVASASGARRSVDQSNAIPVSPAKAAAIIPLETASGTQEGKDMLVYNEQEQIKKPPSPADALSASVVEVVTAQKSVVAPSRSSLITLHSKTSKAHINIPVDGQDAGQLRDEAVAAGSDVPRNPLSPNDVLSAAAIQAVPASVLLTKKASSGNKRVRARATARASGSHKRSSRRTSTKPNTNVGQRRMSGIFANTHDGGVWRSTKNEGIVNDPDVWMQATRDSDRSRMWKRRPAEIRYSTRDSRSSVMREAFTGNLGKSLQSQKAKIVTAVQTQGEKASRQAQNVASKAEQERQAVGAKVIARTSENMKVLSTKTAAAHAAAKEEAKKVNEKAPNGPNLRGASLARRRSSSNNKAGRPSWWYWARKSNLPNLPRPGAGESLSSPVAQHAASIERGTVHISKKPLRTNKNKKTLGSTNKRQPFNTMRAGSSVGEKRRTRAVSHIVAAVGLHQNLPWRSSSELAMRPLSITDFIPDREGIRAALFGEDEMASGESNDPNNRSYEQGDGGDEEASSSSNGESSQEEQIHSKGRRDALGLTPSQQNFAAHLNGTDSKDHRHPYQHKQIRTEPLGSSIVSSSSSNSKVLQERNPRAAVAKNNKGAQRRPAHPLNADKNPRAAGRRTSLPRTAMAAAAWQRRPSVTLLGQGRSARPISTDAMHRHLAPNQETLVNRRAPPVLIVRNVEATQAGRNVYMDEAAAGNQTSVLRPKTPLIIGSSDPYLSEVHSSTDYSKRSIHGISGELLPPALIKDGSLIMEDELDVASDATATQHTLSRDPFMAYCEDEVLQVATVSAAAGSSSQIEADEKTMAPNAFFYGNNKKLDAVAEDLVIPMPMDDESQHEEIPDEIAVPTPSDDEQLDDEAALGNTDGGGDRDLQDGARSEGGLDDDLCSRYQGGSSDGACCCDDKKDPYARAHQAYHRVKSLLHQLMSLRNEVIYLKEDITELGTYHDCCGLDEIMYTRFQSIEKTAFPKGPPECFESSSYGYGIMAYKTFMDKWAVEYINEMIEKRKKDKIRSLVEGKKLQYKLREMLYCTPKLFQAKDYKNDVTSGSFMLAKTLETVKDLENGLPMILKTVHKVVCSWNEKKTLQAAVQQVADYFRVAPVSDTALVQMFELLYPNDPFDVIRFLFKNQNGTEIQASTLAPVERLTPRRGDAVNWCEAKKLMHFLQYRHLHPQHRWPKKNKGGKGEALRGGNGGTGHNLTEGLIDEHDDLEVLEKVKYFDLEGIAFKKDYEIELGTVTLKREYERLARTIAYKIRDNDTCMKKLTMTLASERFGPKKIKEIFPDPLVHHDFTLAMASPVVTIEKYGFPGERTTFEDFIRR